MKQDCSADIAFVHIQIRGALSLFENEGSEILHILKAHKLQYYHTVFNHIGTALFVANDKLEEILEAPQEP